MYCTKIDIFGSRTYPLLLNAIYGSLAERYQLPSVDLLLKSKEEDVQWPDREYSRFEVYYLDNLIEANRRDLFQVRFSTAKNSRELSSIFLSVEESIVHNFSIQFPGRSGQYAGSHVIGDMKSVIHTLHFDPRDLQFETQGFPEQGMATYIKEHSLSAFSWVGGLGRYLHVREDPRGVHDVRRGRATL